MASNSRDYEILLKIRADLRDALGNIKQVDSAIGGLKRTALEVAGAFGIGFSIAGLVNFVKSTIDANQQLGNMSKTLGISTEMLSALDQAARKSGLAIEDVQTSLVQLSRAETGQNASGGKALEIMGIQAKDAAGNLKPLPALLQEVSTKFNNYAEGPAKAALATALFGKSGAQLIPLLDQLGKEGLQNLTDKAIAAGTAVGHDAVEASQKFGDAMDTLKAKLRGAVNEGLGQFTPEIEHLSGLVDDPEFQKALSDTADGIAAIAKAASEGVVHLVQFISSMQDLAGYSLDSHVGGEASYGLASGELLMLRAEQQRRQSQGIIGANLDRAKTMLGSFLDSASPTTNLMGIVSGTGLSDRIEDAQKFHAALLSDAELSERIAKLTAETQAYRVQSNRDAAAAAAAQQKAIDNTAGSIVGDILAPNKKQAPQLPKDNAQATDNIRALAAAELRLQNILADQQTRVAGPLTAAWIQYNKTVEDAQARADSIVKLGGDAAKAGAQVSAITQAAAQVRDEAVKRAYDNLRVEFLTATGQTGAAAAVQLTDQWQRMLDDLRARSDTAGVAMIKKLINVELAQAQLQELQRSFSAIDNIYSIQAQALNADQGAGLISQLQARQKLLDLNQQQATALEKLLPLMREQARITGSAQDIVNVAALEERIRELRLQTSALGEAIRNEVMGDFDQLFTNLLANTESAKQAFADFFRSVAAGLAKMAFNELAQRTVGSLLSKIGGNQPAEVSAGATKLTAASGILTLGATLLGSNADKLQAAAATLLAANAIGGFASGGYTGPGGVNQVAGYVHAGEVVFSQRDVARAGGVGAVEAMRLRGYAEGGLVHPLADVPAPAQLGFARPLPIRADLSAGNGRAQSAPAVSLRIENHIDSQVVYDALDRPQGEAKIVNIISRNQTKLKQWLR